MTTQAARKPPARKMQAERVLLSLIDPDPANVRVTRDAKADDKLLASVAAIGPRVPLLVRRNGQRYMLVDGHRRFDCLARLGEESVDCVIVDGELSKLEVLETMISGTALHEKVSLFDICDSLKAFREDPAADVATDKALAERLGLSQSFVSKIFSVEFVEPGLREALEAMPRSITLLAAKIPAERQAEFVREVAERQLSRDEAAKLADELRGKRKPGQRRGKKPVKLSALQASVVLPGDYTPAKLSALAAALTHVARKIEKDNLPFGEVAQSLLRNFLANNGEGVKPRNVGG